MSARRCTATSTRSGERCRKAPIKGGTVCPTHGGSAPLVARAAAVRAEVQAWGLSDAHADPGETLLRLVSQSARRAALYSSLLERQFDAHGGTDVPAGDAWAESIPAGVRALIGNTYASAGEFGRIVTGEEVRGLALLEAQERDRCAKFCKLALDAGIAERQVRVAEAQGALLAGVVERILDGLGLSPAQRQLVATVVPRELRALDGGRVA